MIEVDISNIWGNIEFHSLIQMESRLSEAAGILAEREKACESGWHYLMRQADSVFEEAAAAVMEMRQNSSTLVVIGSARMNQFIRAAVVYGRNAAVNGMSLCYAGESLDADALQNVMAEVQNTDFSVLIADRITTVEQAIALRQFKWLLNRKYGPEQALQRIYAVLHADAFQVCRLSQHVDPQRIYALGKQSDDFPAASCMIPIAAAGLDPSVIADGVKRAAAELGNPDMDNPVWLYAAARVLLFENGEEIEEFHTDKAALQPLCHWCCQTYAETDQRCERSITAILNPYVGYSYRKHTFETALETEEIITDSEIQLDLQNDDGLNYLAGKTLCQIESCIAEELSRVKAENHYPAITIRTRRHGLRLFGYLSWFFQLAADLSAQMLAPEAGEEGRSASLQQIVMDSLERKFRL